MNEFITYLKRRKFSSHTIKGSIKSINIYQKWVAKEGLEPEQVTYQDLLGFMKHCSKTGKTQKTTQHYLNTVRHYYDHLAEQQRITTNPVTGIEIKGVKRKVLHHILEPQELHTLYNQYPDKTYRDRRNKVILGLLVYQGIKTEELARLTIKEI